MRKTILLFFIILMIAGSSIYGQVENVPLQNPVYDFLKEMKVKQIIPNINDDNPNLSCFEVREFLEKIEASSNELSNTENNLLQKYKVEFYDDQISKANTWQAFGDNLPDSESPGLSYFDKVKYMYVYREEGVNMHVELIGNIYNGQSIEPSKKYSFLIDGGLRFRGTLFDHLGYYFMYDKGAIAGSNKLAEIIEPRILSSFKYVENLENYGNYENVNGYLKYFSEPIKDMRLSFQLGREKIKYGYGYGSKLVLSGDNPDMDFFKLNFKYGAVNFSSVFASTVGEFNFERERNYTKYFVANKVKLSFPGLLDVGIGESIIYSERGIELGYLNPFNFYKIVEMSLQDRDNGTFFVDMQTHFIKDLELQATFFMDENILFNLDQLDTYINKTAYQVGAFWYEPLGLPDLSLVAEYTRIRPYVYTHTNYKNSYSAFGSNLGHRIGPNADELYFKLAYNVNEWFRINLEYERVRSGDNIYDNDGTLVKNVGGDMTLGWRTEIDPEQALFLEGARIDNSIVTLHFRLEPIRDIIFDLIYKHNFEKNLFTGLRNEISYGLLKIMLEL